MPEDAQKAFPSLLYVDEKLNVKAVLLKSGAETLPAKSVILYTVMALALELAPTTTVIFWLDNAPYNLRAYEMVATLPELSTDSIAKKLPSGQYTRCGNVSPETFTINQSPALADTERVKFVPDLSEAVPKLVIVMLDT